MRRERTCIPVRTEYSDTDTEEMHNPGDGDPITGEGLEAETKAGAETRCVAAETRLTVERQ